MAKGKRYRWGRPDVKREISSFLNQRIGNRITHQQLAEKLKTITGEKISRRAVNARINKAMKEKLEILPEERNDDSNIIHQEFNQESQSALFSYSNLPMEHRMILEQVVNSVDNLKNYFQLRSHRESSLDTEDIYKGNQFTIDSDPIDSRRKANVEQEFIEETESEAIRFELHLNQCLRNNVVTISAEKAGYYYQYRRINKVGNAEYYECKTCGKNGARATLRNGRFTVSESRQHNEKCLPIRSAKIIGKQADREARLDASQGVHPHIASERGFEKSWKANAEDEYPETFVQGGPLRKWYRNSMEHIEMGNIPPRFQNLKEQGDGKCVRWILQDEKELTIFSTDLQLETMAKSVLLCADATFRTSPKGTVQCLYIHGLVGEDEENAEWIVLLLAIMNAKNKANYEKVVKAIKENWQRLDVEPTFSRIHIDYEEGLQRAFNELKGENAVYGCQFHYCYAVKRKIQALGLMEIYSQQGIKEIWLYLRICMALSFLPDKDRAIFWKEYFKNAHRTLRPEEILESSWPLEKLQKFSDYIDQEWMTRPGKTWSNHGLRRTRNTNRAESYHRRLNYIEDRKPSMNKFLENRQVETARVQSRINKIRNSKFGRYKPRKKKYIMLDRRLEKLEKEFDEDIVKANDTLEHNKICCRYLYKVSYLNFEINKLSKKSVQLKYSAGRRVHKFKKHKSHPVKKEATRAKRENVNKKYVDVEVPRPETPDVIIDQTVSSIEVWPYHVPTEGFLRLKCSKLGLPFHRYVYGNIPNHPNIREGIPIVIDNARGDGSCGYRSLAHLLCGDQEEHLKVRQVLCEFIEGNSIPGYKELYPEGIREANKKKELPPNTSGVLDRTYWMTDADIVCAAVLLEVNILIFSRDTWMYFSPEFGSPYTRRFHAELPSLLIDNRSGIHFDPILQLGSHR